MKTLILTTAKLAVLLSLAICATTLPAQDEKAPKQTEQQQEAAQSTAKININTASLDQLTTLPRVGPTIGARIISFREEHGGFEKVEELMNVKGIGQKTFERLKTMIEI